MRQKLNSANCITFLPAGSLGGSGQEGTLAEWKGGGAPAARLVYAGGPPRIYNPYVLGESVPVRS